LGLAFVGPDWYWAWVGRHNHEASYQGRPTRYWSALLRRDFFLGGHLSPGTQKFLGIGGNPAVLQGDPAAGPVLLDLVNDEDMSVRWTALSALSMTRPLPVGVPRALTPLVKDPDNEFRISAAETLAALCSDETIVVPAVLPLLQDPDQDVRRRLPSTLA